MYREKENKNISFREHVLLRPEFYKGSPIVEDKPVWMLRDNNAILKNVSISEMVLGVIDEAIDNAIDHYITENNGPNPVSYISVSIEESGHIVIENDGSSMPIGNVKWEHFEGPMATGLITQERSGSNFDDEDDKNPDRVTGGLNGIGIKLTNIMSKEFELFTCDGETQFIQLCTDNMDIIHEPVIEPAKINRSMTRIRFLPDYDRLCVDSTDWFKENYENLVDILRLRMYKAALFVKHIEYRYERRAADSPYRKIEYNHKANILFNDEVIDTDISRFMKMFGCQKTSIIYLNETDNADIKFPWLIGIGLTREIRAHQEQLGVKPSTVKPLTMSLVNGVNIVGSHVEQVINKIANYIAANNEGINPDSIKKYISYFDVKQLPIASFNFDGNRKQRIKINGAVLNEIKAAYFGEESKKYKQTDEHQERITSMWDGLLTNISKYLEEDIKRERDIKLYNEQKKKLRSKKIIREYIPATACKKEPSKCALIPVEGDSALGNIVGMITSKRCGLGRKYFGLYCLQGVPINAVKKSSIGEFIEEHGRDVIIMSEKLQDHIGLTGLAIAIGLDPEHHYDLTPEGDKQFAKLNYGRLIMATDQDVDGIGQICSLVLAYIVRFWPNLIKRGFFNRLNTPIIKIISKKDNKIFTNFYSEFEYEDWLYQNYGSRTIEPEGYIVRYYKGLASNSESDMIHDIGKNFHDLIVNIGWDDEAVQNILNFYDHDTEFRKEMLQKKFEITPGYIGNYNITVSDHLFNESKRYMLDFIGRKMPSALDGLAEVQRKVLAYLRKVAPQRKKIYQIGGGAASEMCYEHGDSSINEAITKMAQIFPGTNHIPILCPSGKFGDINKGCSNHGHPRYIYAKYNTIMNYLFPKADDPELERVYMEGTACEPKYYVPIIPYAAMEHYTTPTSGWKIDIYARERQTVFEAVRALINGEQPPSLFGKLQDKNARVMTLDKRVKTIDNEGNTVIEYVPKKVECSVGKFTVSEDSTVIHITQLPLRVWIEPFIHKLLRYKNGVPAKDKDTDKKIPPKRGIIKVIDDSDTSANEVSIYVHVSREFYAIAKSKYREDTPLPVCIALYLGLIVELRSNLNMVNKYGAVVEFSTYDEVLQYWYEERYVLYGRRLIKDLEVANIKLIYYTNIRRFIDEDMKGTISIDDKPEEKQNEILAAHKYAKFNSGNFNRMNTLRSDEIRRLICEFNTTYDYIGNIKVSEKSSESIRKLDNKIAKLRDELVRLENKTIEQLWLDELDDLENRLSKVKSWDIKDVQYDDDE